MVINLKLIQFKQISFTKQTYLKYNFNLIKQPKLKFLNQRNSKAIHNNEHFFFQNSTKTYFLFKFWKLFFRFKINTLYDIICTDFINKNYRFTLNYNCINLKKTERFFFKIFLKLFEITKSVANLFKSSVWLEREIWDMYGIFFENNPDLRRILTDYGFIGFPLRKNFPLLGFFELRYDFAKKSVIFVLLELTQEFRNFDFDLSWNITY